MDRQLRALLNIAALLGSAGTIAAQEANAERVTIRVPENIGAFRLISRKDFPDASSGVMLRYQRPDSLYADLFVYPGPDLDKSCNLACANDVLRQEGDDYIKSIPVFIQRGYADTMSVGSDSALQPMAGAPWRIGRYLRFDQRKDGVLQWSDFYVYYLPDVRVKVRATYARDSIHAKAVADFAAAAAPALTGHVDSSRASSGSDLPDIPSMVISTTLSGTPATVFPIVTRLLTTQGWTIADSSSVTGRLVSAPSYAWPKGAENETWHKGESPGVRLKIQLDPSGDSTIVRVSAESPTRENSNDAKVAQMLEMLTAVNFASELPKPEKKKKGRKKS
jgi:hypothetical protein